jgi:hypothetical protein
MARERDWKRVDYNERCVKASQLLERGVDYADLRERFNVSHSRLTDMLKIGRELRSKKDAVQNTA